MLLAEAGLLDGHDATTHWAYCDVLRQRYPKVDVHPQRALVVSGEGQRLVMAGGGTSWLDLALYLIARFVDADAAMQVARLNLIDWHAIGQQPFARLARTRQVDDAVIGRCQEWIAANYRGRTRRSRRWCACRGLPERSFKRRFRAGHRHVAARIRAHAAARGGEAPARDRRRAGRGRSPTRSATRTRASSAACSGGNVGLTPAQYRKRFRSMRRAIAAGHGT